MRIKAFIFGIIVIFTLASVAEDKSQNGSGLLRVFGTKGSVVKELSKRTSTVGVTVDSVLGVSKEEVKNAVLLVSNQLSNCAKGQIRRADLRWKRERSIGAKVEIRKVYPMGANADRKCIEDAIANVTIQSESDLVQFEVMIKFSVD